MQKKVICVIVNGYAEEMMAAMLMDEIRQSLCDLKLESQYCFIGGSLVSNGKWFQDKGFTTFFSGGMSPSGGFPTRSVKGFFADFQSGAFASPFTMSHLMKKWKKNLSLVIALGDFLLMMTAIPTLSKKTPLVFIPTAKSDYIQSHFLIEKILIKKFAILSFPRDRITTDDFSRFGIRALYYGNLIQDLLDPNVSKIETDTPLVALLPGSRDEAYENLGKILFIVEQTSKKVHWAFVQAGSLDLQKFAEIFIKNKWIKSSDNSWTKNHHTVFCYTGSDFDRVAISCDFAIGITGTAGEQIIGLGKPVIGISGTGSAITEKFLIQNQKLLGNAFIYEKDYPQSVIRTVEHLLNDLHNCEKLGAMGLERMGRRGATKKIASHIVNEFLL